MSRITVTKKSRAIHEDLGVIDNRQVYGKIIGYRPAQKRSTIIVEYLGHKMEVLVSIGQIINSRKEYFRRTNRTW